MLEVAYQDRIQGQVEKARLFRMRLPEPVQSPHESRDDERGDKKGRERGEILCACDLEVIVRLHEKIIEAGDRHQRKQRRRYKAVEQGQSDDDDEINAGGACRRQREF